LVVTVPHREYTDIPLAGLVGLLRLNGVLVDVKSAFNPNELPGTIRYWSL